MDNWAKGYIRFAKQLKGKNKWEKGILNFVRKIEEENRKIEEEKNGSIHDKRSGRSVRAGS